MSGIYPSTPVFSTSRLTSNAKTFVSFTQSGNRQTRSIPGHGWRFAANYPSMTRVNFMPVYAFAVKQKGRFDSFQITPPDLSTPQGVATGTPLVAGASQTGNTLDIDGCTASITGWLKAGDIFTYAGSTKVYMVVEDADTDGVGATTLTIEPALIESPANNAALTVSSVQFTMMLADDNQIYNVNPGDIYGFEIDLIEVL